MTQSTDTNNREILLEIKADIKELSTKVESIDKRLVAIETTIVSLDNRLNKLEASGNRQIWVLIGILGTVLGKVFFFPNP